LFLDLTIVTANQNPDDDDFFKYGDSIAGWDRPEKGLYRFVLYNR